MGDGSPPAGSRDRHTDGHAKKRNASGIKTSFYIKLHKDMLTSVRDIRRVCARGTFFRCHSTRRESGADVPSTATGSAVISASGSECRTPASRLRCLPDLSHRTTARFTASSKTTTQYLLYHRLPRQAGRVIRHWVASPPRTDRSVVFARWR